MNLTNSIMKFKNALTEIKFFMSQTLASASQNVYDGKDMVSSGELKKVGSIKLGSLFKLRLPER